MLQYTQPNTHSNQSQIQRSAHSGPDCSFSARLAAARRTTQAVLGHAPPSQSPHVFIENAVESPSLGLPAGALSNCEIFFLALFVLITFSLFVIAFPAALSNLT